MCRAFAGFILILFYCQAAYSQLDAGDIATSQGNIQDEICYGSAPQILVQTRLASGGILPYTYQWQRSNDGQNFSDIRGAIRTTYSPPVLGKKAWFRLKVVDYGKNIDYSNTVEINVLPNLTGGIIGDAQTVCYGTAPAGLMQKTPAGGGSANYSFQWESSTDGYFWNEIQGATSSNYYPSSLITDTWFRRLVSDASCGTTGSNPVKITTYSQVNSITDSLFRTETPGQFESDVLYELGTTFEVLTNGVLTKTRLFTDDQEDGLHVIRLWKYNGTGYSLVSGPYNWSFSPGFEGWRNFVFPSPINVTAGRYIISISNGPDKLYAQRNNFNIPSNRSIYIRYINGVYTDNLGQVPDQVWDNSTYFRDIVFYADNNGYLTPGSIGYSQSICFNSIPASISQLTSPSGGNGTYSFQWQSSVDNITWTNIDGATSTSYTPEPITENTFFRRAVSSGSYCTVFSEPVIISIFSQPITQAELHDDITIYNNTSTNLSLNISGGKSPYSFSYSINGDDPLLIIDYISGDDFSTGALSSGTYTYSVVSITDADGCITNTQDFDVPVTVSVLSENIDPTVTNKALVVINTSESVHYNDYINYVKPYLGNFGIPYDECDVNSTGGSLPQLGNYAVIIFGHLNVYDGITLPYPISQIETAVNQGVGLYSFDPHLFDYNSQFNSVLGTPVSITANRININSNHYITNLHNTGIPYSTGNDYVNLLSTWNITQNSNLVGGATLAQMTNFYTVSLLQATTYGAGRIVRWCGYDWMKETYKGPVYGLDDLIWRGIVWAARKPFIMQGIPPMVTMRVDDVNGLGTMSNFAWIDICNEFGIIPWCGLFIDEITNPNHISKLKSLIDNNKTTASPHSFFEDEGTGSGFIFYNHGNLPQFDHAARTRRAKEFFDNNLLLMSKYLVAHYYEIGSQALEEIKNMGIEFIGTVIPSDAFYTGASTPWINCGPYRINRSGLINNPRNRPLYYGGNVTWSYNSTNYTFFNCATEIRDLSDYDWYPSNDVPSSVSMGVNFLRRALNSMILPTLFTHYYYLSSVTTSSWRSTLNQITNIIGAEYSPIEFRSMDFAVKYLRARNNITVTNVNITPSNIVVSYSGNNDLNTRCYVFTEDGDGVISYRFLTLPLIDGSNTVCVLR